MSYLQNFRFVAYILAFIRLFLFEAGGCPGGSHQRNFPGGRFPAFAIHSHFINFFRDSEFRFFSIVHHNG